MPLYLQRNLAQLLFEFRGALTSELLDDPQTLGICLARRATNYTEHFRIFCENTTLVGQVAAALLSGENEPMPYLTTPALARIVEGLSEERQARNWLKSARDQPAARGFRTGGSVRAVETTTKHLPRATDPRLFLRRNHVWDAYAELPNLTVLSAWMPKFYGQLRVSRAKVNGGARPVPPSGLLYPGQEVRFECWPRADKPFSQLEQGDDESNRLLPDQCVITTGPWWLFRRQDAGLAIEVKGKFVRPGHQYMLVGVDSLGPTAVSWCTEVTISTQGVKAYEILVPPHLSESEEAALVAAGLDVVSHVAIRPVGIVASAWDSEGEVEWLAGEPAMLGIRSESVPRRVQVMVNGAIYFLGWTPSEPELLFTLEGLSVGTGDSPTGTGALKRSSPDGRTRTDTRQFQPSRPQYPRDCPSPRRARTGSLLRMTDR